MKLTDRSQAGSISLNNTIIYVVNTNDTTQNQAGSSYFATLQQVADILPSNGAILIGGTANNSNKTYTFTNNTGGTFSVVGLTDLTITGGTYLNEVLTLTNNTGGTFNITGITSNTDSYWTSGSTGLFSIKSINNSSVDATGDYSIAEGYSSKAIGDASHAEGILSTATGNGSHAEGNLTVAYGLYSHAEGNSTTGYSQNTHAEGNSTLAFGQNSHAEGQYAIARGFNSHAQGNTTIASGASSHAGGSFSQANGIASLIHSTNSVVNGDRSVVLGGSNISGTTNDMVYVPFLNIQSATTNNALTNLLVKDSNGNINLRNVNSISTNNSSETITNNEWNFSGAARQYIYADVDKSLTITNATDSIKSLHIIHTVATVTVTVNGVEFPISGATDKVSVVIGSVINNEIYLLPTPQLYQKVTSGSTTGSSGTFPTQNRFGLWTMSTITASNGRVDQWDDADGGGSTKRFAKLGASGSTFSAISGVTFTNGKNIYVDPNGINIGKVYTMYALVQKTGDGGLFMNILNPYFIYFATGNTYFRSNAGTPQNNTTPVPNMSGYSVVAVTFSGGTNAAMMYVDGNIVGSFTSSINETNDTKLYGLSSQLPSDTFNGWVKGFAFFTGVTHSPVQVATNSPLFKILAES
jgi:hypothetical protein